jgi:type IV secretion system protein VirB9
MTKKQRLRMLFMGGLSAVSILGSAASWAAEVPQPSAFDDRVRYITYNPDQVVTLHVRRGAVTRVVLGEDEQIVVAASGFVGDCTKAEGEWCIRAETGTNQVWIKPKDHATHNNLEIRTDKRDYSFELNVLPDNRLGRWQKPEEGQGLKRTLAQEPMYRVIFRHARMDQVTLDSLVGLASRTDRHTLQEIEQETITERLTDTLPEPRNLKYSMEVLAGGEDIAPSLVFDDGRFTYFRFPPNHEIPSIFVISPRGEETRINFHMEDDLAVVQRTGRRFVLRLGAVVVGIWNEAFDETGIAANNGVTVPGLRRVVR